MNHAQYQRTCFYSKYMVIPVNFVRVNICEDITKCNTEKALSVNNCAKYLLHPDLCTEFVDEQLQLIICVDLKKLGLEVFKIINTFGHESH